MVQYLLDKDWVEFERCYPSGTAWLRGRNLWREREALHHEIEVTIDRRRAVWIEQRLSDLDALDMSSGSENRN